MADQISHVKAYPWIVDKEHDASTSWVKELKTRKIKSESHFYQLVEDNSKSEVICPNNKLFTVGWNKTNSNNRIRIAFLSLGGNNQPVNKEQIFKGVKSKVAILGKLDNSDETEWLKLEGEKQTINGKEETILTWKLFEGKFNDYNVFAVWDNKNLFDCGWLFQGNQIYIQARWLRTEYNDKINGFFGKYNTILENTENGMCQDNFQMFSAQPLSNIINQTKCQTDDCQYTCTMFKFNVLHESGVVTKSYSVQKMAESTVQSSSTQSGFVSTTVWGVLLFIVIMFALLLLVLFYTRAVPPAHDFVLNVPFDDFWEEGNNWLSTDNPVFFDK